MDAHETPPADVESIADNTEADDTEKVRKRWIRRLLAVVATHAVVTLIAVFVAFVIGWAIAARGYRDLEPWHRAGPESEFVASDAAEGYTLDDYLAQEAAIFDELDELIDVEWAGATESLLSRYRAGSPTDPRAVLDRNWNRTFVLAPEGDPVGGVLLVHGLSDSPYSMRALAEQLRDSGWLAVGLRVPGHGTTPAALGEARIADWKAAVRVAAAGVRERVGDAPTIMVGFSNGGALVVSETLREIDAGEVHTDGLVLISPMIGVSPFAQLTRVSHVLSWMKPFEKFKWLKVEAEIDPFKYSSFSQDQSERAWLLTKRVESRIATLHKRGELGAMPPVLAFQSVVDSTVNAQALVDRLMSKLPAEPAIGGEHRLVLFDVNARAMEADLLKEGVDRVATALLAGPATDFALTVIGTDDDSGSVASIHRPPGTTDTTTTPLDLRWPEDVFSLSHGCLAIPADDPILGTAEATQVSGLPFGTLSMRGETGVLSLSPSWLIRQRFNPFFRVVSEGTDAFAQSRTGVR